MKRSLLAVLVSLALPASAQATACHGNRWGYVSPTLFPTIGNIHVQGRPAGGRVPPCEVAEKIGGDIQALWLIYSGLPKSVHVPVEDLLHKWNAGVWRITFVTKQGSENPYQVATATRGRARVTMDLGS